MSVWLTPQEAGDHIKVAVGTLANWRSAGVGPQFVKVGRLIRYDLAALDAWISTPERRTA